MPHVFVTGGLGFIGGCEQQACPDERQQASAMAFILPLCMQANHTLGIKLLLLAN
jgi:hypothetical protein